MYFCPNVSFQTMQNKTFSPFSKVLLFGFISCLSHTILSAQIDDPKAVFRELRVLEGTWFMPTDRGDKLEVWTRLDDTTLAGRSLRIRRENGDTVNLESMRIELRDTTITFYRIERGRDKKPIPYVLTTADYDGYLFEGDVSLDPNKIRYVVLGNREIQITTETRRGGKQVATESVFEREFTPGGIEFRLRGGLNAFSMRKTGNFNTQEGPAYQFRPGYDIGAQVAFRGRGGYLTLNFEVGLSGRFFRADSRYLEFQDTVTYAYNRAGTYRNTWLMAAFVPEISFKREGRLSVAAGPYVGRLIGNNISGDITPKPDAKRFEIIEDFNKQDFGIVAGFQYRYNIGKKDLGGIFGLRAILGLTDLDNLYDRGCDNPAFCNGRLSLTGLSLYYSLNLLNL